MLYIIQFYFPEPCYFETEGIDLINVECLKGAWLVLRYLTIDVKDVGWFEGFCLSGEVVIVYRTNVYP